MFGFGGHAKEPLADAKSAERWFASFPANDPLAASGELLGELARLSEPTAHRNPAQLQAVFRIDALAKNVRKTLAAQYIEHASRSSKIENQLWRAMFDLTQGFLQCYQAFTRDVALHAQSNKWQALVPELVARQLALYGRDAKIRLFRHELWIPAKWAELHALFTLACSRQIERQQLALDADGKVTTIEHEYLVVLTLQLLNTGNLTPRRVEWLMAQLDEWCAPLRFTLEPSSVASFYIDVGSRAGLRRRQPAPLEGRVLFLDTRPLHALLMQDYLVLEQKMKAEPLSEPAANLADHLSFVARLASQVDPEFKPFGRRSERTAAVGMVDAILGFGKIAAYLLEEERVPIPESDVGTSFGATMDLAVFGRTRNEGDRRAEFTRRRLASFAAPGGPGEVKDVSQTGFRVIAPMRVVDAVTLGTLAAIRAHGQDTWTLGVVRRMKRLTTERAEIGLQLIANALTAVELVEQRKPEGADYSVDGEAASGNGRSFPGLYLVLRRADGATAAQSLIVPAVEYQPTRRYKVRTAKSVTPIRLGRLIEQQSEWAWTAADPLELGGRGAVAAAQP